jgi:NAD(P)-dependent dehydrogenase (short-subunit alcohol dehydrogenase family)
MSSVSVPIGLGLGGRVAAVTGGANGIGRACALALAGEGAIVVSLDLDRDGSDELVTLSAPMPGSVVALIGDACDPVALARVVERAADVGGLDIAVNVVGSPGRVQQPAAQAGPTMQMTAQDWSSVVDATLLPTFVGCKAFAQAMIDGGRPGSIVNIGASLGIRAAPHHAAFAAAKAGVHHLTQSLSFELAPHQIRVNCIAPLFVETPGSRAAVSDARRQLSAAAIPLGRVAQPEDIAGPVLFLASRLSSFVTGQTLLVDGGLFCTTLRPPRGWVPPPTFLDALTELSEGHGPGPGSREGAG